MNNIRLRKLQKVNMLQIYWDRQEASGIKTKIRAERKNELGGINRSYPSPISSYSHSQGSKNVARA